jgi:hypothetical protein
MKTLNIKNILTTCTVVVLMAGCLPIGPKTERGAIIGAGTGAVVGAVTGSSVIEGAAVGTAIGAGVGYMQDTDK